MSPSIMQPSDSLEACSPLHGFQMTSRHALKCIASPYHPLTACNAVQQRKQPLKKSLSLCISAAHTGSSAIATSPYVNKTKLDRWLRPCTMPLTGANVPVTVAVMLLLAASVTTAISDGGRALLAEDSKHLTTPDRSS